MKKSFLLLLFICCLLKQLSAQEFSFKMYFFDAIGNSDTITLGYDLNGTNGIDSSFGELNYIDTPYTSIFDVRISDEWMFQLNGTPSTFHLKKQIIQENCANWFTIQGIDIYCENWPVTVVWDTSLFNNSCLNGSVFTSVQPGGWWDVGSQSDLNRQELLHNGSVTFTSNYLYVNNSGDSISTFWQVFADSTLLSASLTENAMKSTVIYPSPTTGVLYFNQIDNEIDEINLLNIEGKILYKSKEITFLDVSNFSDGTYIVSINYKNGFSINEKIEKHE